MSSAPEEAAEVLDFFVSGDSNSRFAAILTRGASTGALARALKALSTKVCSFCSSESMFGGAAGPLTSASRAVACPRPSSNRPNSRSTCAARRPHRPLGRASARGPSR
eukprot:1327927-Pyramimonas_sp.AAC.1